MRAGLKVSVGVAHRPACPQRMRARGFKGLRPARREMAGRLKWAKPAGDGRGTMRRPAASAIGRNRIMAAASPKRCMQLEWAGAGRN